MRMLNKVVLVTGGASGIGQATCRLLATEGAVIALADLNENAGEKVAENLRLKGLQADFWKVDASQEEDVQRVIHDIVLKFGRIDVLVNNVGVIGDNKPTHELTEAEWDRVMNVNVKSVFFCTKHAIPHFKSNGGGNIVNVSSVHGLLGSPDYPANHASKGAVRMMSKTDAMLYAKDKIRVNSVYPGYIWTSLLEHEAKKSTLPFGEFRKNIDNAQVMGHAGEPEDVAYAILYLASSEARFVTGSEIIIDGGLTCGFLGHEGHP